MKKIINIFFVSLGVIFFVLILISIYLYVADPFNIKPLIELFTSQQEFSNSNEEGVESSGQSNASDQENSQDDNTNLSIEQKAALEKIGVDPSSVPNEFTQEQQECFEGILGSERVEEIKAGSSPSATEFFKARECL